MGLKDYLYRKLEERNQRKELERGIRAEVEQGNYGKFYAENYKKKLERDVKAKFNPPKTSGGLGIRGKLKKRGILKPDTDFISRALFSDPFNPQPLRRNYKSKVIHHRSKRPTGRKRIAIYT